MRERYTLPQNLLEYETSKNTDIHIALEGRCFVLSSNQIILRHIWQI